MAKKTDKNNVKNNDKLNLEAVTKQFSANLRTFIEQQDGLSQKKFAEATGFAPAAISGFLNRDDPSTPSLRLLCEMKRVYGISIDEFLTKNITPADYNTPPETTRLVDAELEAYTRFVGTYYLYYLDTSNYKGNDTSSPSESLMYGVLHIYATPSSVDKLSHNVICIMGIGTRQEAVNIHSNIENNKGEEIENYVRDNYSDSAYYGDFELNPNHAFISLTHKSKDRALIILHRTPSAQTYYNSGIGTINSISRGREPMPTIQYIGLSRRETSLSEDELHRMLLLNYISVKDSRDTDELISDLKKSFTDETRSDYERNITVRGEISNYVRKVVERNLFRVGKISNRDDDSWYHNLKDTFIDE